MQVAYIQKFLVAVASALTTTLGVMSDGISNSDIIVIILAFLGAFGVFAVPNKLGRP